MAENAQSAAASAVKLSLTDPADLLCPAAAVSAPVSTATFSSASILNLASAYNKLHLGTKIKPPDIINASVEDFNNNNIDASLSKVLSGRSGTSNEENFPFLDNLSHHSSDKWSSLRSESPFLAANTMMSPPPPSSVATNQMAGVAKTLCSGVNIPGTVQPSMHSSNGSIPHKCTANGSLPNSVTKKGENCMTHAMPNTLWCLKCHTLICRACAGSDEHRNHNVKTQAKEAIRTEIAGELVTMQKSLIEVQHLVLKQRDFLLKILDSCCSLKSQIENELISHAPTLDVAELRDNFCRAKLCLNVLDQTAAASAVAAATATSNGGLTSTSNGQAGGSAATSPTSPTSPTPIELYKLYANLTAEKQRLHQKYQDLYLQCKFDDLLRNTGQVVDFETISRAMQTLHIGHDPSANINCAPLLLLANYCLTQIYARQSSKATLGQMASHNSSSHTLSGLHLDNLSTNPTFPFATDHSNGSSSSTQSSFGGTKSPFLDLAVGSPVSTSSHSTLPSAAAGHLHHPLHFSQSVAQGQQSAASHLINSSFSNSFADNILLSNPFQSSASHVAGTSSTLSTLRHSGNTSSGAGGISFEMNGISVPISMISSQKFPSAAAAASLAHPHHPHHHHHHHLLHSTNLSSSSSNSSGSNSIICNPTMHIYPIYYFNIEINGQPCGRILIEVRNDVAPRMAKNFGALASGELGFGYKGCQIFQCWENESIITGDFELNNGRGGRSVFEDGFFMPDDTKILAIRGSVGMRRSQKRHDNMGLVGSQFRIILREMRGFTGIFAFVIEGLELVEKISQTGDSAGKPQSSVLIVSCGKLQ